MSTTGTYNAVFGGHTFAHQETPLLMQCRGRALPPLRFCPTEEVRRCIKYAAAEFAECGT